MIKDKLSGILDKLEDNAEGIGSILGIMSDPMADGRGISAETFTFMMDRITHWRVPNPGKVFELMLVHSDSYPIMQNAMSAMGGWALGEFGSIIDPKVAKVGRIVKKGALGALFGNIVGGFIWLAGPSTAEPATGNSDSGSNGYTY